MTDDETVDRIDMLLEEAAAFARGGEPLEALARARFASEVLARETNGIDVALVERLRARVVFATERHQQLASAWQRENAARHDHFLAREAWAIARGPRSTDEHGANSR